MPGRRKVGNLLALAVLSTLWTRPMHRYEVASVMRARGKDQDMQIKWGSLYTVVDNMARHGLVEAVETSRQGARPERTTFRITDEGRAELLDWTRELIADPASENPRFAAGLSVLAVLPPDDAAALLHGRLRQVEADIAARAAAFDAVAAEVPRLFLLEEDYRMAVMRAEAAWIAGLVAELDSGGFPGLEAWRSWHVSGELPADLAELAERGATTDHD
ncbi:PadR family transcriptional regulator [Nakamurella endophytica]|uniref:PadR family transcriptional regulator n=1 Tax=Nakamurella endophytica TaxID=1748367 RepID=A0A917WFQ0_9ACTN|nr:PadR family transcriptional regulator [Nakamurella endophytica]GGL98636.1 PadR family transcriptional regulator [Nakamurella endophytica]